MSEVLLAMLLILTGGAVISVTWLRWRDPQSHSAQVIMGGMPVVVGTLMMLYVLSRL